MCILAFLVKIVQLKFLRVCLRVWRSYTLKDCEMGDRVPCGAQWRGESTKTQRFFFAPSVFISHLPVPSPLPRRDINLHQHKTWDNIPHETSTNTITHIMLLCLRNMEPFHSPYVYSKHIFHPSQCNYGLFHETWYCAFVIFCLAELGEDI